MLHDAFGRAAEENMLKSGISVCRHDDEIGADVARQSADFIERGSAGLEVTGPAVHQVVLACEVLQLPGEPLLRVLVVANHRKWNERRCRRHDSGRVIKLVNVRKMNGRAKTLSQTLRGFDRLDRHLRKIDRHENVPNTLCFHIATMNSRRDRGSPSLAKGRAFFVRQLVRWQ